MSNIKDEVINNKIIVDTLVGEDFKSSLSGITSILESYQGIFENISTKNMVEIFSTSLSKTMQGYMDCMKLIDYSAYTKTFADVLGSNFQSILKTYDYSRYVENITKNLSAYIGMTESMQNFQQTISDIVSSYQGIFSHITSIPREEFDAMLDGTDFTREDVLEDIEQFEYEVSETFDLRDISENVLPEEKVNAFLRDHPALAYIVYTIAIIWTILSGAQVTNDMILPQIQSAIVSMQDNDDIYFIKVDSAKLYVEPSSYSSVTMQIPYGEQVTLVESIKLWDKVTYIDSEGEEIEGWIAKRNLMTYCDYQFKSDDLYNLD